MGMRVCGSLAVKLARTKVQVARPALADNLVVVPPPGGDAAVVAPETLIAGGYDVVPGPAGCTDFAREQSAMTHKCVLVRYKACTQQWPALQQQSVEYRVCSSTALSGNHGSQWRYQGCSSMRCAALTSPQDRRAGCRHIGWRELAVEMSSEAALAAAGAV